MEYRKLGECYYIQMDRGEAVVAGILEVCRREGIQSATYSGIGGCESAEIQTFIPEQREFETQKLRGMLELVSLNGSVFMDGDGVRHSHTHALFAYIQDGQHCLQGGHLKETTVLYTAEIELRPVVGGTIGYKYNPATGTGTWKLGE